MTEATFFFPFSSASCLLKPRRPEVSVLPFPAPGVPLPGSSPPKLTHQQLFTSLPAPPGATRATRRSLPTSHFADTHSLSSALLLAAAAMLVFFFFSFFFRGGPAKYAVAQQLSQNVHGGRARVTSALLCRGPADSHKPSPP